MAMPFEVEQTVPFDYTSHQGCHPTFFNYMATLMNRMDNSTSHTHTLYRLSATFYFKLQIKNLPNNVFLSECFSTYHTLLLKLFYCHVLFLGGYILISG